VAINFQTDPLIEIEGTLTAVTDTELWLSAEATNGGASDSIIIDWSCGNVERNLETLWYGMGITIGTKIRVRGERNYWPQAKSDFAWVVLAKVA
jgi:hypothetical protein